MPGKLCLFVIGLLVTQPAAASPKRFVSMNLCTDQLLMLLADKEEIVSVSYLAARKDLSVMTTRAQRFYLNHGQAEEIMRLKPDLVLAGVFSTRTTVFMLKKLGYRVEVLPVASHFSTIRANIRKVASLVGHPQRGEQLIAQFDERLESLKNKRPAIPAMAVFYRENGYTTGKNTLANAILKQAGFSNLAAQLGISGSGHLSLEELLMHPVDVLIKGRRRSPDGSVAAAALLHPAYRHYAAQRKNISINDALWICGTPFVLDAVNNLLTVHRLKK
ncbi:ABC transporter substrate-binding protein [methane-oxidizing endosymbiont of Gigantopelta aegis]|uniref:ABC transporter substrate-binding protein n=1 Tax=methane-oxidizing endosymbiont of Gigantopelta aegis TaxID=2794938 RepID=UPI0018DC13FB|nr:ABC transporter substrate-binding protein [methane-oxidizing endosymbiont of Gigantopelta aegis]